MISIIRIKIGDKTLIIIVFIYSLFLFFIIILLLFNSNKDGISIFIYIYDTIEVEVIKINKIILIFTDLIMLEFINKIMEFILGKNPNKGGIPIKENVIIIIDLFFK